MTRILKLVGGVILLLAGILFTLQGLDIVTGSGMSGQTLWVVLGPIIALVGAFLVYTGVREQPAREQL